ncbi:MAG: hypothetical protein KGD58_00670 [Candidatus Lokiarchaeota archaeon]|nr:hypothetical protein [Candidatus Lokiarchaeota archaeon]
MRERECFKCGKILDFESFIKNINPNEKEDLTSIWESDYIEFYCCKCYIFKIKYQPYDEIEDFSYY